MTERKSQPQHNNLDLEVLKVLMNGRTHTMERLAAEFMVSYKTIQRSIERISMVFPIHAFKGGADKGGIRLDARYIPAA